MENNIINKTEKNFEDIKHIDENGVEFWYARELMEMLEYSKWENFREDLPTPSKSTKQIEKEKNRSLTFKNKKKLKLSYLIYTRKEKQSELNLSDKLVTRAFKELSETNLIKEEKQGYGKPKLIYIGKIEHTKLQERE